jgi:hypothetical protein
VKIPQPGQASDISLGERVEQMRTDPLLRHHFPAPKPSVSKADLRSMADNFDVIARDETVVK